MALIFVTRRIPEIGLRWLFEGGHEVVVSEKDGVLSKSELAVALASRPYDGMVSLLTDEIGADVLESAPNLKIVANYAVGFNNIDVLALHERGVVVTNTPGVITTTVAEYAIALILAVVKRIPEADRYTRSGRFAGWAPELFLGGSLSGRTLGIVGAGRIGSEVARRLTLGFGMRVIYHDVEPNPEMEQESNAVYYAQLEELLREADVVSVHVPLLPSTRHLINADRLAIMKPSAYFINTSRGEVIDETALVEVLRKGLIKGAGLDVFEKEPALASGLTELNNVVLTPHIASASEEARKRMSELVAFNINEFFLGREVPNRVKLD